MPELPDVIPGEVIAANTTNQGQRRMVQRYANAATRDAENPTPETGDLAYQEDNGQVQVFNGSTWVMGGGGISTGNLQVRKDIAGFSLHIPDGTEVGRIFSNTSSGVPTGDVVFVVLGIPVLELRDGSSEFQSLVQTTYPVTRFGNQLRNSQIDGGTPSGGVSGDWSMVLSGASQGVWYNNGGTWQQVVAGP